MSVYLDASVLVALFTDDAFSSRADAFLRRTAPALIISDFASAELAFATARKCRVGMLSKAEAQAAFSDFDACAVGRARRIEMGPADVAAAEAFLRRLDLTLGTADAINIAIAQRLGATLATLDRKMAVAKTLGVMAEPI